MSELVTNLDATRALVSRELQCLADNIYEAHESYAGSKTIYQTDMDIVVAQAATFHSRLQATQEKTRQDNFFQNIQVLAVFLNDINTIRESIDDYKNSVRAVFEKGNTRKNKSYGTWSDPWRISPGIDRTGLDLVPCTDLYNPSRTFLGIPRYALSRYY